MKKLLALVLALVMTMGLATVGTSAAFADAASIEHSEAVEVLNALGVVGGKENNNFDPTANVKRSEMAKMVTIAMLGDVDVSAFAGAPTDLTDINGHWAEGYIKYCYSQGIIGGRGNGKFDPDANVTATEAAKMLLVAIGYSAEVQGYGGDQWKVNVARDAQLSGFYADLKGLTVDKVLTRDETAQLVYNAMDADLIEKKPTLNVSTGTIQYTYEKNTRHEDLLGNIFKAYTFEGTLDMFSYDSNKAQWTLTVAAKDASQVDPADVTTTVAAAGTAETFKIDSDVTGLFKQNVKVLFTLDSKGKLDKAVGVYPSDSEVLVSHVIGKIDAPNAGATKLRVDGKDYSLTSNVSNVAVYNFQHAYLDAYVTSADTIATAAFMTVSAGYNASEKVSYLFSLIDNTGDGKGDVIVVFPKTVAKVSSLSSGYVTLTDGLVDSAIGATTTVKLSDIDAYDGIAKNDYVFVTPKANTATNRMNVEKAELQTGTVSATKTGEEQIGGAWLKSVLLSGNATAGDEVEYIALNGFLAYQAGTSKTGAEKFVAVLDKETTASGYTGSATLTTKLLFSDGTKKDVKVSYWNGEKISGYETQVYVKGLYAYTMDGDNYKLYDVTSTYVGTSGKSVNVNYDVLAANSLGTAGSAAADTYTYVYRDGSAYVASVDTTASTARIKMTSDSSIYAIADDAVIFVYKDASSDVTVTTGAQLKKISDSTAKVVFLAADKNSSTGFNEVKLAYVYNGTGVTSKSNYAFAMDDVETVKSGSNYYKQVSVWDGTALTTLKTESKSSAPNYLDTVSKGKAFSYSLNASGVITEAVTVGNIGTIGAVAVTAYDEGSTIEASDTVVYKDSLGTLTYTGSSTVYTYTVDDDTEIFYVNMADGVGVASGSVSVAVEDKFGNAVNGNELTNIANAVIVRRGGNTPTDKVDLIVIDIGGDILGVRSK